MGYSFHYRIEAGLFTIVIGFIIGTDMIVILINEGTIFGGVIESIVE